MIKKSISVIALSVALMGAQTLITPPRNQYSVNDDIQLGRQAASQVEKQLPVLRDDAVTAEVNAVGRRLVQSIPARLEQPEFRYTFHVVNLREINAFALPGGPVYVNRGMLERSRSEGQVAGVLAHELSHVVLRHGTAQATKATKYEVGALLGAVVGAVVGGRTGQIISEGTQFGLGTAFLRFSREYEKQADLLGAQIMADAGYDPRDMAEMFRTIERESGSGGPQWLSDHPNPGNRYTYINQEAQALRITNPVRQTATFSDMQARLRRLPPAPTMEQVQREVRDRGSAAGEDYPDDPPAAARSREALGAVAPPSTRFTTYTEGGIFQVTVPSNWREIADPNSVLFAPEGAFGRMSNQRVFTHGIEFGLARNETHGLPDATTELIDALTAANPRLSRPARSAAVSIGGRRGQRTLLTNTNQVTGEEERVTLYTTLLGDGTLFYAIGVAPRTEQPQYAPVFTRIADSIRFISR